MTETVQPTPKLHQTDTKSEPRVHRFKHQGKTYKLFKRLRGRDAPWYLVGTVGGRRMQRSLDTNVAEVAVKRALANIIEPALKEQWGAVDATKLKRHFATVRELVEAWRGLGLACGEQHRRAAANALFNLLRRAGHERPEAASAEILNGRTVRRFFDSVNAGCAELDQIEAGKRRRSANSIFNQAKAVVQPAAVARYRDAGLNVPDVREFIEAGRAERFDKCEASQEPPEPELVARVLAEWPLLEDWNEFAAVGLELAFGLRAGEVAQARWDWFGVRDGYHYLHAQAEVKNGSGRLSVCALNPFWETFVERAGERRLQVANTVLEGSETERGDLVFRRVSAWLRGLGWPLQKTNHGLRAYAGGEVAVRYGLEHAQVWLRHRSITTTQGHYTGRWVDARKLRGGSAVEWARAAGAGDYR